jgi:uncharacterized protein GlcG (DUF336 family)
MRAISLKQAVTIIEGTFAEAEKLKLRPLAAVVLDAGGRVKAGMVQDRASMLRFEVAQGKAYATLSLGRPSRLVLAKAKEKPIFVDNLQGVADQPLFLEGGGQLIRDTEGEVIGAIGVTGDVNEMDDIAAVAGIRSAGFKSDYDFTDADDIHRLNIKESKMPQPAAPQPATKEPPKK